MLEMNAYISMLVEQTCVCSLQFMICVRLLVEYYLVVLNGECCRVDHCSQLFEFFFYLLSVRYYDSLTDNFTHTPTSW